MRVHVTFPSRNVKTGPIPVTTSSADTCPPSCPFNTGACYAKAGPLALHWRKVTQGERGLDWSDFLKAITSFPMGIWRHNQAGDLAGEGERLDTDKLDQLVKANARRKGFTYTHKPLDLDHEMEAVKRANEGGFTVNLSANNLNHADSLVDLAIGPVTVVLPASQKENTVTPKGRKVVICPATTHDNVTCQTCGLCAIAKRDCIIGFPSHGTSKNVASRIASA